MTASASGGGEQVTGAAHASFLAALPFLVEVPAEDLNAFANTVLVRTYRAGQDIVVQRQYGHAMFVMLEGAVGISVIGNEGESLRLGRLEKKGDYFGEAALLGRGERTATVTAETDVTLLELEKHRFDLLCRRHRSVREHLEGVYHARAIATYMRTHRYLGKLDDATRAELGKGAKLRMFQRGDAVTKPGDAADTILLIKDGVVKATRASAKGGVSILAYFNTHDVVGSSDGTKRDYGLEAVGQCEVIQLGRAAFTMAMVRRPDVAEHFKKDDMSRRDVLDKVGGTMIKVVDDFLKAGVEVESLLVINLDRCVRCGNCVRACHSRHEYTRLDRRGPIFRRRTKAGAGHHEHLMLPASCRHCRDPECMIGCPTGAIQREASGDVDINNNCIGCENCARKCPYGNITMRPLAEKDRPSPEVTKRAIKCNLCRGYSYSNCVHECPRGALLRVDPLRYFEELALVMEAEQKDAIEWTRSEAKSAGLLGTKQQIRPRSTWFIPASFVLGALMLLGVMALAFGSGQPLRGGSPVGIPLGITAASCLFGAAFLGARKRMNNTEKKGDEKKKVAPKKLGIGKLEAWTQFHMMLGLVGFVTACAHAGFQVTGVFTTLLMLVFALEVITGSWGQIIYMRVPKTLTRLERHGLARLVEDLHEEEATLARSIAELAATLPAKIWKGVKPRIDAAAGSIGQRMAAKYDPPVALEAARKQLGSADLGAVSEEMKGTVDRVLEMTCRHTDVRAQLRLHRALRRWLVWHVATASALVVLVLFHITTALTLI
jgi:Fe-S-cluster-containing dehydrogenase component/CRP-like cAMP-binding protein